MEVFRRSFLYFLSILGVLTVLFIGLSFTHIPYKAYHHLSAPHFALNQPPSYILILGDAGMPSADGLQRTHFAAAIAKIYPEANIIIAHTENFQKKDSIKQLRLMAHELVIKEVDTTRIGFEFMGTNTYTQAKNVFLKTKDAPLLVVTSPEHMLRAILTLRKAGFSNVGGVPTFETPINEESLRKRVLSDDISENVALRHNIWSYMIYEIKVLREYTAISYYWLMEWI